MSTFKTDQPILPDLVRDIVAGKIQLPDFQRGWVWDDEHVRSLLVSIARSFPVGAVMLLDTGGDIRFQVRPIENVHFDGAIPEPEKLILDGQQRLTSLTQVLALDKPVNTFTETKKKIRRYYYIDIRRALEEGGLDEAFIAVPEDRKLKEDFNRRIVLDLSTPELECQQLHFPCNQILNSDAWEEGLQEYAPEHFGAYMQFRRTVLNAYRSYQLPVIALGKSTRDFFWKATIQELDHEETPLDIHHIFPRAWCEREGLKPKIYNAIINKTPISYKANRTIGGKAPSSYLEQLQNHQQVRLRDDEMDEILKSHRIDPESLRADDFEAFYQHRKSRLLELVETAMGKSISHEADASADDEDGYLEDLVA